MQKLFLNPVISIAVELASNNDQENLSIALDKTQEGECLNQSFSIFPDESDVKSSLKWVNTGPECEFLDKPNKIKVKKIEVS